MNTPIDDLMALYGNSVSAVALALGEDRQLIDGWKKQEFIPFKRGKEIEEKTGGKIKAVDIWEAASRAKAAK